MVFPPVADGSTPPADEYLVTSDGRYFVVRGRLWRTSDPGPREEAKASARAERGGDAPASRASLYDEVNAKIIGELGGCQGAARPAGAGKLPASPTHLRYIQRDGVTREG
jgi:hypothetical protein